MKKIFFLIFLLTFSLIFGFLYQTTRMDLTSLETVTQIRLQMTGDTYRQAYDVFYGVGDIVPDGDAWHDASLLVISQGIDQRRCTDIVWRPSGNSSRKISLLTSDDGVVGSGLRPFSIKIVDQRGCLGRSYLKMRTVSTIGQLIRELYTYESMRHAGVITPSLSIGRLTLTIDSVDRDFGWILIEEPIDERFIREHLPHMHDPDIWKALSKGGNHADLSLPQDIDIIGQEDSDKSDYYIYELKNHKKNFKTARDHLVNIMKLLSQPSPELDHWFREVFDTDVFLRSETINTLLGNIDGYSSQGNNYFLFSDRDTADTVFVPLDFDRAFFGPWRGHDGTTIDTTTLDPYRMIDVDSMTYRHRTPIHPVLTDRLLSSPDWRQKYTEYLRQYMGLLEGSHIQEFVDRICDTLVRHGGVERDSCGADQSMIDFASERHEFVSAVLQGQK